MDYCENSSLVLEKALAGDGAAWDALFAALWPVAAGVAAATVKGMGGAAMAEDIAQNAFVRLMESNATRLRSFNPDRGTLEAYVAKMTRNCAIDYLRSNAKHFRNADISTIPEPRHNDSDPLPMVEEWEMVAAMKTLTPRERQVIGLLFRDNLDSGEAAKRMNISQETIRSEKSHALKKLKHFFGQE